MGAIIDIYQLVKDLIDSAKNQKNMEMVEKLLDIQKGLFDLQDENYKLKRKIDEIEQNDLIEKDLEIHPQGYLVRISEREAGKDIRYCVACWQNSKKLMPYTTGFGGVRQCNNCKYTLRC